MLLVKKWGGEQIGSSFIDEAEVSVRGHRSLTWWSGFNVSIRSDENRMNKKQVESWSAPMSSCRGEWRVGVKDVRGTGKSKSYAQ
jgi:hypothetical protein